MKNRLFTIVIGASALLAVAMVFHRSGSTVSAQNTFTGSPCQPHRIADSLCTRCHPELAAVFKKRGDWCAEHKLPESQCYLCNPGLREAAGIAGSDHDHHSHGMTDAHDDHDEHDGHDHAAEVDTHTDGDLDHAGHEHRNETEQSAPSGKPQTSLFRKNAGHCAADDAIIQLASIQTAERTGLELASVERTNAADVIEAVAEVEFDATTSFALTSLVAGTLVRWTVLPGQQVNSGQVLAYLESLEAASLKAEYLHAEAVYALAQKEHDRQKQLASTGLVSPRELQEAEADFLRAQADQRKAAAALKALGFSETDLQRLVKDSEAGVSIPVRARHSGTLVEQRVDLGALIGAGETIGVIAETEQMWVEAQVRERELSRVRAHQSVTLSSDGSGLNRTTGEVVWVADAVDPATRMGRVRIAIERNGSHLRAHQFVRARIAVASAGDVTSVPSEAVQWEGCCNIVFVSETIDRFRPRKITIEYVDGDRYAVTGLREGERIVTKGSYLLKTELMKGSLGAGCCGHGA